MNADALKAEKSALRKRMVALRAAVPPSARAAYSLGICSRLLQTAASLKPPALVAVYLAMPQEIDLSHFIANLPHGVALAATILAKKRGEDAELAAMAGLMHDLHAYRSGSYDEIGRASCRERV